MRCVLSNILIQSLGKADKATAILKSVLADSLGNPDIITFPTLINAWAETSLPDAVNQAFAVLRLLNEHPKYIELGIRPDTFTFSALLKCFSKSNSKTAGKKAVKIADEMDCRYKAGNKNVKPDDISFTLASKTCLRAGGAERAEALLVDEIQELRDSNLLPRRAEFANVQFFVRGRGRDRRILTSWIRYRSSRTDLLFWSRRTANVSQMLVLYTLRRIHCQMKQESGV